MLAAQDLTVGYGTPRRPVTVLTGVDAAAHPGRFVGLVGPNGAGKSTLLRTLARLQAPLAGAVTLGGHPVDRTGRLGFSRRVAVVLTDRVGVDHLGVTDLVALGRHPHLGTTRLLRPRDHAIVRDALATVGAEHLAGRLVASLSDGQRQRVMIARALAQEPAVLLLDEPTSFLDPAGRIAILTLLRRLAHDRGTAVVCSTHEVELALAGCDDLWVSHAGRLVTGSPATLAADGTLASAFATDGVVFDPTTLRFHAEESA